jgi:hypothetical protein
MSADIKVGDGQITGWSGLEERYGILLDPRRLKDEPAVVEGRLGRGKVILSLVHFDTPGDRNGIAVLRNLWRYLITDPECPVYESTLPGKNRFVADDFPECNKMLADFRSAIAGLMAMGEKDSLWRRRNPWFLQWRRGIRGMEYSTLAVMIDEIAAQFRHNQSAAHKKEKALPVLPEQLREDMSVIRERMMPFVEKAKLLLAREKLFLTTDSFSPVNCPDGEVNRLREELFGSSIRYGGEFKQVIDAVDQLLYKLIKVCR